MKTQVRKLEQNSDMTANMKKLFLEVIKDPKHFGRKLNVNKTRMMVESTGDNTYKVTEYLNRPSVSGGTYEKEFVYNVEVVSK